MKRDNLAFQFFQVQYLERAEKLKTYLNGKSKKKPVKEGGSGEPKKGADKVNTLTKCSTVIARFMIHPCERHDINFIAIYNSQKV